MKFFSAGFSHIGHVRQWNEDAVLNHDAQGLYAVADGLGGIPGGEAASNQVVASLKSWFASNEAFRPTPDSWRDLWQTLNDSLREEAERQGFVHPIGTTLALLFFHEQTVWWSHLGDTRVYRLRKSRLQRLTRDHTMLEKFIDNPQDPEVVGIPEENLRHMLTRCLGSEQQFDSEITSAPLEAGDRFLICSDGVWWPLGENRIQHILSEHSTPESAILAIEKEALELDGTDNLSAVVVDVQAS